MPSTLLGWKSTEQNQVACHHRRRALFTVWPASGFAYCSAKNTPCWEFRALWCCCNASYHTSQWYATLVAQLDQARIHSLCQVQMSSTHVKGLTGRVQLTGLQSLAYLSNVGLTVHAALQKGSLCAELHNSPQHPALYICKNAARA